MTLNYYFRYMNSQSVLSIHKLFLSIIGNLIRKLIQMRKVLIGAIVVMSLTIALVSAFVYETSQHTITQTVQNIATLTLQNSALGNIEEGQTVSYTKATGASLGDIVTITTTKDGVVLHFDSDIQALTTYYTTYTITVKYAAVGSGSTHIVGDTACTMTIGSPDPAG